MTLPRRLVLVVPVTGLAVAVAVALVMLTREEPAANGGAGAPTSDERAALLVAEFGTDADRVFLARADDPSERTLLATISHAPDWGINPGAPATTDLVAYTVLPPGASPDRTSPAELYVLDTSTGETRLLAGDADLLTPPVMDRAGTAVAYRSNGDVGLQSLVSVDLDTGARRTLYQVETTFGVFPVGFEADGRLLFAALSRAGTELYRATSADQPPELVVHASDEVARDWQLSPDGGSVSFLAPAIENERVVHRLQVVDLTDGTPVSVATARPPSAVEEFTPVWRPDGSGITVGREAYPDTSASAVTYPLGTGTPASLPAPARGYDVPAGWSADGDYLAVRSFDGVSAQDPGTETLVVVTLDGKRVTVTASSELLFLGWADGDDE
ncbi:MAG: hypothetical protein R3B59_04175 [Dehalococcoidia bacterium]